MELKFDTELHRYTVSEIIIPSVTQIIKADGHMGDYKFSKDNYAMNRGTLVHHICELDDNGILDEDTVGPDVSGYLAAYRKFRKDLTKEWTEIEKYRFDKKHWFAGCPDRVASDMVVDIKTSASVQKWWGLQLAAYAILVGNKSIKRYSLRLNSKGTYKMDEHKNASDFDTFISAADKFNGVRGIK